MSFRPLETSYGRKTEQETIRLSCYSTGPAIIALTPKAAEYLLGGSRSKRLDVLIDTDSTPTRLALLSPGSETLVKLQANKTAKVFLTKLRKYVGLMPTVVVTHSLTTIDDRKALVIELPSPIPSQQKETE